MAKSGVYKIEFEDGSFYVGQSVDLDGRSKDHFRMLQQGNHHSYKVQGKYNLLNKLPVFSVIVKCPIADLTSEENKLIDLNNELCLNIKAGADSNFGENALTAKYFTHDIEQAFLMLVDNPGIPHKYVADFVGIDINTVHDISAGRNRAFTEMSIRYPDKYAELLKNKAYNTRGKTTIVLKHKDGREISLVTGQYSKFCRENGVQSGNLSKVLNGSRNSTVGWSLVSKHENF